MYNVHCNWLKCRLSVSSVHIYSIVQCTWVQLFVILRQLWETQNLTYDNDFNKWAVNATYSLCPNHLKLSGGLYSTRTFLSTACSMWPISAQPQDYCCTSFLVCCTIDEHPLECLIGSIWSEHAELYEDLFLLNC